ncbi:COG2426 family protein [Dorea sp. D27]|uniref:COG2426 family protein n=1 Tax=Dorea sp. D27 TaxID=658665 RepID=UPI000673A233|nr:small multi-drug export protein [Dorea sp. D27]KMZ53441.1 small multidrug export protein [Dorea sp. D27]
MTETLVQNIIDALGGSMGKEAIVFIISMIPILELRGALLVAGPLLGVPVATAIPLCIIGNIIPVPFILWLITPIFNWMKGTKKLKPMVDKLESKAMSKSDKIEKYEFWGLVLFVGIPLPGTGAWTGALIASLLGVKFKKAFPAIILGICVATVIMWFISYVLLGGVSLLG